MFPLANSSLSSEQMARKNNTEKIAGNNKRTIIIVP